MVWSFENNESGGAEAVQIVEAMGDAIDILVVLVLV